ncbi:hypothetical protein HGI47_06520 [Novosphingobium sp. ERN07]|nr:hypothetical protein [Novosphingobium sp. ERN07]
MLDVAKIARYSSVARTEAALRKLGERLGVGAEALARAIAKGNAARRQTALVDDATQPVCLIAGNPLPDDLLYRVAAQSGWHAVGHTLADQWTDRGPLVNEDGDPFVALARQINARQIDTRGFFDRAGSLVQQARVVGAKAAVLWLIEEDDTTV